MKHWFDDAAGDDVVLTSAKWLGGDLAGVTIEYDYFDKQLKATDNAYVDFFGYAIDSPDVNKRQEYKDTWCENHGWENNDGNSVVQFWDWYYDIVRRVELPVRRQRHRCQQGPQQLQRLRCQHLQRADQHPRLW